MMKPDVIYITGTPGSGKTTLAKQLADKMYSYTHVDPDDLLQSFWETNTDPAYDRGTIGIPKMHETLLYLVRNNVRLIFDAQADKILLTKLNSEYSLVNIHCTAIGSANRFYDRELLEDGSSPDWLEGHMSEVRRLEQDAREPIDVGQKIILVDCTNDYSPTINELLEELGF